MQVKFKKLVKHAVVPQYSREGDGALDLVAIDMYKNYDFDYLEVGFGLAVEVPPGHIGLLFPRSSISKTPHLFCNAVGLVDSNFRGELKVRLKFKKNKDHLEYQYGDRVAQLVILPIPLIEPVEVTELSETNRGSAGWGSTGR